MKSKKMAGNEQKSPLYEVIAQELESVVSQQAPGQKLPSVREIMRQYGVSQLTVDRSLTLLSEKGLIEKIPGRGAFVGGHTLKPPRSVKTQKIEVCFFFKEDTLHHNPLYRVMSSRMLTEAHTHGHHLSLFAYEEMGSVAKFREYIERSSPDVMILMCVTKMTFEQALRSMGIPVLCLFPNVMDETSLALLPDNFKAVEMVVDHLTELGHQKIAYFHGQGYQGFYMLDQEERLEAFYGMMRQKELMLPGKFVRYGGFTPEEGYRAAAALLAEKERPTAIICNDYNVQGVYRAAQEHGLRVPEDLSVVGFDDMEQTVHLTPPLTTIHLGWEQIASFAVKTASELLGPEAPAGQVIRCPVSLSLRSSTALCAGAASSPLSKTEKTFRKVGSTK